ncbi:TPA: hypothetical protein P8N89_005832 [Pseudomonas aeruginosa]|uniref:hypothetical protein n=1 Tax=Pseudomonas aeruginosa TaxID=287 RepID=UPI0021F1E384|nr:hypothetical protein [Pseudomonas aeruginosa]MCV6102414.1 hypothetical protein [Pseudomonas aeruginosa]MDI2201043.1 hypothetical protein [Pseudomonas aeruginosa]MDY1162144.1 hypothetical protein [Pseudomonas aeruginosa]HBO3960380.1 hypothetical protein [Pseudomonas aeruginosa]HBO4604093.1 hypothetical protein [Pseudomonas aeruginosa]
MKKYEGSVLEHNLDKKINREVIVSVVEAVGFETPVAYVAHPEHLKSVAKHYIEEGKRVFLFLEYSKFDTSIQVANDLGCGLVFECGSRFENALKANPLEVERLAGQNGISQNTKRIAAIYANSVPFSMTREQAESEIAKTVIEQDDAAQAIELFGSLVQKNRKKAAEKNAISVCKNVSVKEFGYHKYSAEGLEALREEMRNAYSTGGVHVWKLPMGIGKTAIINELIALAAKNGEKPVYVAPRVNISRAINENLASNYLNDAIAGSEHELDALSICVNSITRERFKIFLEQSRVLILEEIEQMIAHIAEGVCKNRVQVYNELVKLIKNARLIIGLDANSNDEVIELLQHAYQEIHVLQAKSDNSGIEVVFGAESSIQREIMIAAESRQKSIVMVEFPSQADAVKKVFDDKKLNSLVVTAETRDFPEVAAFIANPNEEILKYDGAIIYNSAMQSSTSIEIEWANRVFGMFKGVLRVSDMTQMLRRYRPATQIMLSIDSQGRAPVFNEEINKQYNMSSNDSKDFNAAALRVHRANIEERKAIKLNLAMQLEYDGYRLSHLDREEDDGKVCSAFRKLSKEARKNAVERIIALAHSGEVKSLTQLRGKNITQKHVDEEYIINAATAIGIKVEQLNELTEDDIRFFTRRDAEAILHNASCWFNIPNFKSIADVDDSKVGIDRKSTRKRNEILCGFMQALGINSDGEGIADADKAAEFAQQNLKMLEALKLVTAKRISFYTRNQKLAAINNILKSMGMSLKRYKIKGEHVYKLDEVGYKKMARFLGLNMKS